VFKLGSPSRAEPVRQPLAPPRREAQGVGKRE
jgi:hypothetical protein